MIYNISIQINNQIAELDDDTISSLKMDYKLEEPENWQSKQAGSAIGISFPATPFNDKIFNTFHNPNVADMTTDNAFTDTMPIQITINGRIIFKGEAILQDATSTDKPERYTVNAWSSNGDWLITGQNLTLWDCLPTGTDVGQTFSDGCVQRTWSFDGIGTGVAFGSIGADSPSIANMLKNCFVYAPVRYKKPFGDIPVNAPDTVINLFDVRPSLFVLPIIYRFFAQLGYTIDSQFMGLPGGVLDTTSPAKYFFPRLVLPWVWGDFYDITSELIKAIGFKCYGTAPNVIDYAVLGSYFDTAITDSAHCTTYQRECGVGAFTNYVMDDSYVSGGLTFYSHFQMPNTSVPLGFDNFGLYSFQETAGTYPAGTMIYFFNPPVNYAALLGSGTVSINFSLKLYLWLYVYAAGVADVIIEVYNQLGYITEFSVLPGGAITGAGGTGTFYPANNGTLPQHVSAKVSSGTSPTTFNFTVSGVAVGDTLHFRLKYVSTAGSKLVIMQSGYLNNNPVDNGADVLQWDSLQEKFISVPIQGNWQLMYSTFEMTGLQLELGQIVNFQQYDNFKNYKATALLKGLVEAFDLEIQTDPINKVVTIEPMFPTTIDNPYSGVGGVINYDGFFRKDRILDWTQKKDWNKQNTMALFSGSERQIDFSMKQDGSDGGQNIWSARYKGIYLNNVLKPTVNENLKVDNNIIAGVPGASRYMLPNRFSKGNKQLTNSFFSQLMHYNHQIWAYLNSGYAPQLPCVTPEATNSGSSGSITLTFEPKLAFYHGQDFFNGADGLSTFGFPWQNLSTLRNLPLMYSVYYGCATTANTSPVLSFSDQLVNDGGSQVIKTGLMRNFHLQRLAIMRNGQLYEPFMRLNLSDLTNFLHREQIMVNQAIYALLNISKINPTVDESVQCQMWKIVKPQQTDIDNSYPSSDSMNYVVILSSYDLKYAPLLLFVTDLPQL